MRTERVTPPGFVPAPSVEAAAEYARSLGIEAVTYRHVELAATNLANEAFAAAYTRGHALPPEVASVQSAPPPLAGAIAFYDEERGVLTLVGDSPFWRNPAVEMRALFESRYLTSANPLGVVFHEIGHHNHWLAIGRDPHRWLALFHSPVPGPKKQLVIEEVGRRAAEQQVELVAEVYHGLMVGRSYSDEVYALYLAYGGPTT